MNMSAELRGIVEQEWDAYCCGGFGPDPLFFSIGTPGSAKIRDAGIFLHRHSGADAMLPFRRPVTLNMPYAVSFTAGYLLHFLLDSHCHPYVYAQAEAGVITHFALESEFDRYLIRKTAQSYPDAIPVRPLDEEFCSVAARMDPAVTTGIYRRCLRQFRTFCCQTGRWSGTPVRHIVNGISRIPAASGIRGLLTNREPDEDAARCIAEMENLLDQTAETAAQDVEEALEAMRSGRALPSRFSCNYAGIEVKSYGIY